MFNLYSCDYVPGSMSWDIRIIKAVDIRGNIILFNKLYPILESYILNETKTLPFLYEL